MMIHTQSKDERVIIMPFCPNCGAPIAREDAIFCPTCGREVHTQQSGTAYDLNTSQQYQYQQQGQQQYWQQDDPGEAASFNGCMSRPELKQLAKARLSGNWGVTIGATLLAGIIMAGASYITIGIGSLILTGVISFGLSALFMELFKVKNVTFSTMFSGFENFGRSCLAGILQGLLIFAWSLLFVIPGIIKTYAYAMTYYILNDHPEMSALEAITASKEMMNGHKGELFVLSLSFIGWMFLSALTSGILYVCYVGPYISATTAAFYENLKAGQAAQAGQNAY